MIIRVRTNPQICMNRYGALASVVGISKLELPPEHRLNPPTRERRPEQRRGGAKASPAQGLRAGAIRREAETMSQSWTKQLIGIIFFRLCNEPVTFVKMPALGATKSSGGIVLGRHSIAGGPRNSVFAEPCRVQSESCVKARSRRGKALLGAEGIAASGGNAQPDHSQYVGAGLDRSGADRARHRGQLRPLRALCGATRAHAETPCGINFHQGLPVKASMRRAVLGPMRRLPWISSQAEPLLTLSRAASSVGPIFSRAAYSAIGFVDAAMR